MAIVSVFGEVDIKASITATKEQYADGIKDCQDNEEIAQFEKQINESLNDLLLAINNDRKNKLLKAMDRLTALGPITRAEIDNELSITQRSKDKRSTTLISYAHSKASQKNCSKAAAEANKQRRDNNNGNNWFMKLDNVISSRAGKYVPTYENLLADHVARGRGGGEFGFVLATQYLDVVATAMGVKEDAVMSTLRRFGFRPRLLSTGEVYEGNMNSHDGKALMAQTNITFDHDFYKPGLSDDVLLTITPNDDLKVKRPDQSTVEFGTPMKDKMKTSRMKACRAVGCWQKAYRKNRKGVEMHACCNVHGNIFIEKYGENLTFDKREAAWKKEHDKKKRKKKRGGADKMGKKARSSYF